MERLPTEILTYILQLAVTNDQETACRLCLVSQTYQKIVLPIFYRHICLQGIEQVESFNATIKMSPKLGDLIHGVTLLDKMMSSLPCEFIDRSLHNRVRSSAVWIKPWRILIRYLGVLSRQHNLSTLVLSSEACTRLQYIRGDKEEGVREPLGEQLLKSNLKLDHLIVSHGDLRFFLPKIETKNLTWYGCELFTTMGYLDVSGLESLRSKQMQEINYYFGDNFNRVHQLDLNKGGKKGDKMGEHHEDRMWISWLVAQIDRLCKTQNTTPEVSVYCHVETQEAKIQMKRKLSELSQVTFGMWGNTSDTSQRLAEMESFAEKGWIQKESVYPMFEEEGRKYHEERRRNGKDEEEEEIKSGWWIRPPPGTQWCGCLDLKGGPFRDEDEGQEEFDWDAFDEWQFNPSISDEWSDDSAHWNPMQRAAFAAGESYHYSQTYIDDDAL